MSTPLPARLFSLFAPEFPTLTLYKSEPLELFEIYIPLSNAFSNCMFEIIPPFKIIDSFEVINFASIKVFPFISPTKTLFFKLIGVTIL